MRELLKRLLSIFIVVLFAGAFLSIRSQAQSVETVVSSSDRAASAERDFALRLIKTKDAEERKLMLNDGGILVNTALCDALNVEGNRLYGQIPWPEVLDVYQIGLQVAERLDEKKEIAKALNSVGNTLKQMGDKPKALAAYQRGLKISEERGDKPMIARLAYNMVDVVDGSDKQRSYALALARESGDKEILASVLGATGNVHNQRGELTKAQETLAEALQLRRELGDPASVSIGLSNIALLQHSLGQFDESVENLKESIRLSESISDNFGVMIDTYNLGNAYKSLGDFSTAYAMYQKSIETGKRLNPGDENAPVLTNLTDLYYLQGNLDQAERLGLLTLNAFEKTKSNYGITKALGNLANIYEARGDIKKAIEFREKNLAIEKAEKDGDRGGTMLSLARLNESIGQHAKAEEYLTEAMAFAASSGSNTILIQCHLAKARVRLSQGKPIEALASAEEAKRLFRVFRKDLQERELYWTMAQAKHLLGRVSEAQEDLEQAIAIIEKHRERLAGDERESERYFSKKIEPFHLAVKIASDRKDIAKAFHFSERGRARALLGAISDDHTIGRLALSEADRANEKRLRADIISLNKQLSNANASLRANETRIAELNLALESTRLEYEAFRNTTYIRDPRRRVSAGELPPITLEAVKDVLSADGESAISFVVTDNRVFLFTISNNGRDRPVNAEVVSLPVNRKDLQDRVVMFHKKLAIGDLDFQKASRELYDLLLKPAERELAEKTNIIIVPDGPLWDLPFQALMDEKGKYLVEKAAISYAPSLTALREMSKKAKARKAGSDLELIAFGNPIVAKETSERVKRVFMNEKLEPLPEAERLVNGLGKMYGPERSKILIGNEAREEVAKSEAPKYRIVQFATHGILNNVSPMYSYLVLAQDAKNLNEDGLLETWELKDLNLNADMVILSACDTARGKISGGEGMIGMTWASFIAGAPTTVASQWKVESSSTTEFMLEFHRQLLANKRVSKAEAMRRAALKLMRTPKYKHPSYWGAWVLVGDGS